MKIILLLLYLLLRVRAQWNIEEITELAERFAPIIWLHEEERFFPSSIDFHLAEVELRDAEENVIMSEVTAETLPTGDQTYDWHLNTQQELVDPHCAEMEFFEGQCLDSIPIYTLVRPVSSDPLELEIKYTLFYPYNRGKLTCVGVWNYTAGTCKGRFDEFGHHVSDWEGVTLYIKNNAVSDVYLSTHSFGAYYRWNDSSGVYDFYYGEDQEISPVQEEDFIYPQYPTTLKVEGERVVTYVANGSHGMWSLPGQHFYSVALQLYDNTSQGHRLDTFDKLQIYIWDDQSFPPEWNWLGFEGTWGNLKMGCYLEWLSGECNLSGGSRTPGKPSNFPAPSA